MDTITTAIELVGALAIIGGLAVVVAPIVGVGFAAVGTGAAMIALSWFINHRTASRRRPPGGETA